MKMEEMWKEERRKNMNSNTNVMYIHACFVSCLLVHWREATQIAEDVGVKLEPLSLTARYRVGHGNKMHAQKRGQNGVQSIPGTRP
jgi:hypothetical protein